MPWKVVARIKQPRSRDRLPVDISGYSIHDYWPGTALERTFPTETLAMEVAAEGYLGPDIHGVGCEFWAEEVTP